MEIVLELSKRVHFPSISSVAKLHMLPFLKANLKTCLTDMHHIYIYIYKTPVIKYPIKFNVTEN
jgi:hypothetical protein